MRLYTFNNMYLSSIQQGIQSAHVVHEMFITHPDNLMLWEWANNHKTMVVLNGGFAENIRIIADIIAANDNDYPWAKFHESPEALDGALTSVGVVLPESIYRTSQDVQQGKTSIGKIFDTGTHRIYSDHDPADDIVWTFSKRDALLIEKIAECSLAR